jgi:sugar phosphate isomerase/epimerase
MGQMGGTRVFDRMFAKTDPALVKFEVDVFWLTVGGVDPVAFLKEHKGRVPLLHLKDKASDQKVQYNENVPKATFKEVGSGSIDFPAILRTAKDIGVKHYFVEQDQTPGDPLASLKQSFTYITGLRG